MTYTKEEMGYYPDYPESCCAKCNYVTVNTYDDVVCTLMKPYDCVVKEFGICKHYNDSEFQGAR